MAEQLKEKLKIRRNKKAALTRSINILKTATSDKNESKVVESALERLRQAFKQLEEIHEALVDLMDDEKEFADAETYMEACEKEYTEGLQIGIKYLTEKDNLDKPSQDDDNSDQDKSNQDVARFMLKRDLIANGLVKFDDNPMDYRQWKATFKGIVGELDLSSREELDLLIKWLGTKSSKSMVRLRAVYPKDQEAGLEAVWGRLDDEYGAPELIEGLLISKLESFPKIGRDQSEKLREFSDFLCELQAAKMDEALPGLSFLDTYRGVSVAVGKLPYNVQEGWRKVGSNYKEEKKVSFPPFKIFVDYVCKQSKQRNDPSFKLPSNYGKGTQSPQDKQTVRTFSSTSFKPKASGCTCCTKDHLITDCTKFKEMPLNERDELIKAKGLCRGCLKRGHIWRNCTRRQTCDVCKGPHPTILHRFNPSQAIVSEVPQTTQDQRIVNTVTHSHCSSVIDTEEGDCVSSVIPVLVKSEDSEDVLTYAMLDEQSDACFITTALKERLNVEGTKVNLEISTILDRGTVASERIKGLTVKGLNQTDVVELPATYTRDEIPVSVAQIPTPEKINNWAHLVRVKPQLTPLLNVEVGLLIGASCPRALTPVEVIPGRENSDPYAVRTKLGWGIIGVTNRTKPDAKRRHFAYKSTTREVIQILENDFLDLENRDTSMSADEVKFMQTMDKGVKMVDGHVQLPLPFKMDRPELPNNRGAAVKRLHQLEQKMKKNPVFAEKYTEFMTDVVKKGQAEVVPEGERDNPSWYIPHHGVFHPRKRDKIRVVMDCAARHRGTSLNDHLLQGPNLTNNLLGILLRFRQEPVAVVGDIEGMFYQVLVDPKDRDYLRFLWWKDDTFDRVTEYRMCVHVFGATSSPGCANYALKKVAEVNKDLYGKDASEFVQKGFYVDDGIKSVSSVEDAVSLLERTSAMLVKGGFKLHKFLSNSPEVLKSLPQESIASNVDRLDLSNLPTERTLGILWNAGKDTFTFEAIQKSKPATRRGILSTISAIFDPLGLVGPYVLSGKRILQGVCADGSDWDEPVPSEVLTKWNAWKEQLEHLSDISIRRCYLMNAEPCNIVSIELHHFSDASEMGYGQCSYLRIVDDYGRVEVSLLMSKCRVAPLKVTTIPRLELVAATVSVKVATLLKNELEYGHFIEHFWTDSQVVLGYINNNARRFHTFVANRVQQIKDGSDPNQWHYISTDQNPADIASRGATVEELRYSQLWWHGPDFLSDLEYTIESTMVKPASDDDVEVRKAKVCATRVRRDFMTEVLERFSNWTRAKRVLATCLRFIQKLKGVERGNDITIDNLEEAERVIIKMSQQREYEDLKTLEKLDPVKDTDGLIRVGGRLKKSTLPEEIKHPTILPKKGDLTRLIVRHFHQRVHHQGRGITLNAIRCAGYWIVGGVKVVASYIHDCVTCRKLRRSPEGQRMADLPPERLTPAPPFSYCGVDLFGPIVVKNGRKQEKRYGVLFTCMVSRSVHIEVAYSQSTDSFMNAFRRFLCRRGPIRQLRSDRGSNFVGASQELKDALKEMDPEELTSRMMTYNCEWVFNPPQASHFGGAWERMIRTTRSVLDSILIQHKGELNDEMLSTFLTEAEATINSRPLCTVTDASLDPLTPAHLLTMKTSVIPPPPGNFSRDGKFSRKMWRRVQHHSEEFWSRWRKEYVVSLQARQKWTKERRNLSVSDIVLLYDDKLPRNHWELCRVTDVKTSEDGLVRAVTLYAGRRQITLDRPVSKIVLLIPRD